MTTFIEIELQLFAQEKTEKATPKKRREARQKGQVAHSREVNSALVLIGSMFALYLFAGYLLQQIKVNMQYFLSVSPDDSQFTIYGAYQMIVLIFLKTGAIVAPVAGVALVTGLLSSYAQIGFLFTAKPLEPKLDRLNPVEGLKRILSRRSLAQLLKSLLKLAIIVYTAYKYLQSKYSEIPRLLDMDVMEIIKFTGLTAINIGLRIGAILLIIAALDYLYQRYEFNRSLMMTKQELREEYKQTEGNPQIKSKVRERQRQISMRRMMAEVPKADVVITNPTHFAVALKYDPEVADAPCVVAKGKDLIAYKIKEIALENDVHVVENPPLARSLYQTTDLGRVIPPELYQAVAEVLAFVFSLKNNP